MQFEKAKNYEKAANRALSLAWKSIQSGVGRQSQFGRCKWAFETAVHLILV
jgi:hypothetical protein